MTSSGLEFIKLCNVVLESILVFSSLTALLAQVDIVECSAVVRDFIIARAFGMKIMRLHSDLALWDSMSPIFHLMRCMRAGQRRVNFVSDTLGVF